MAEREGFEPSIPFNGYTPLAGARLRPLGHLSGLNQINQMINLQPVENYKNFSRRKSGSPSQQVRHNTIFQKKSKA